MGQATREIRMTRGAGPLRELAFAWRGYTGNEVEARRLAREAMLCAWSATAHARTGSAMALPSDLEPDETISVETQVTTETVTWHMGPALKGAVKERIGPDDGFPAPSHRELNAMALAIALTSPAVAKGVRLGHDILLLVRDSGSQMSETTCDLYAGSRGRAVKLLPGDIVAHRTTISAICAMAAWLKAHGLSFATGGRDPLQIVRTQPASATLAATDRARMLAKAGDDIHRARDLLDHIGAGSIRERLLPVGGEP